MKRILFLLALFLPFAAYAQTAYDPTTAFTWPSPTTTGQLGNYVTFGPLRPNVYSIDWSITGTAPSVCTFRVEGSMDNVNWYGLDTSTSNSCTTSNMESIAYKPILFLRINILSWTSGGGTIAFHLVGGQTWR